VFLCTIEISNISFHGETSNTKNEEKLLNIYDYSVPLK